MYYIERYDNSIEIRCRKDPQNACTTAIVTVYDFDLAERIVFMLNTEGRYYTSKPKLCHAPKTEDDECGETE